VQPSFGLLVFLLAYIPYTGEKVKKKILDGRITFCYGLFVFKLNVVLYLLVTKVTFCFLAMGFLCSVEFLIKKGEQKRITIPYNHRSYWLLG